MPQIIIDNVGIPFLRLTLLGPNFSGKTFLANALLNNMLPPVYRHTKLPEIYYYLHRLSSDNPLTNEAYDDVNSFMFEIEDTTTDTDLFSFIDMKSFQYPYDEECKVYIPFSSYNPPKIPLKADDEYVPTSQRRMSFLVLFDATSRESYLNAISIIEVLLSRSSIGVMEPIVALVANKVDLLDVSFMNRDTFGNTIDVLSEAERYSQSKTIPFYRISALTKKNVNTMIKEIAYLIYGNVRLWELVLNDD
ncbi:hypothetical protein BEWA_023340 [Theileria equi strain WA]|uniref:Uncharacterized protein n=1 Tax=Theileria equi strain WA TaxID=1537102 RepID=L0AVB7_THEEQ|nr:hypothetical protein BEWA_023340 [Theileria equi strain WA]AFZ79485.1 hypothetical protein BEWA_023340 [Theileria equi strain WA]|eukprot:XP_004829151.1 hypothetical protein BEWA_023340 [Theileria equi strain WA]